MLEAATGLPSRTPSPLLSAAMIGMPIPAAIMMTLIPEGTDAPMNPQARPDCPAISPYQFTSRLQGECTIANQPICQ